MKLFKIIGLTISFVLLINLLPSPVLADACSDCLNAYDNDPATYNTPAECAGVCAGGGAGGGTGGLGSVTNPLPYSGTGPGGGLIILLNNVLRLVFVGAGIYAFIRLIVAGLGFISAGGDSKKMTSAWNSIWQSLLGLIIIIGSFAIAALIGQLLYRDPGAILSPKIYGPN